MKRLILVIGVISALILVAGASAIVGYRWHYINEGEGAQFRGLNVNCNYVSDGDQVICGGRNVSALAVFTFTGLEVEKVRGNAFVTVFRTRRCRR